MSARAENPEPGMTEHPFWRSLDMPANDEWVAAARTSPTLARILFQATLDRPPHDVDQPGEWTRVFLARPAWDRIAARLRAAGSGEPGLAGAGYIIWARLASSLAAYSRWCRPEDAFWLTLVTRPEDAVTPIHPAQVPIGTLSGPERCRLITGWLLAWRSLETSGANTAVETNGPFPPLPVDMDAGRFLEALYSLEPMVDWPALLAEVPAAVDHGGRAYADPCHRYLPLLIAWASAAGLKRIARTPGPAIDDNRATAPPGSIAAAAERVAEIEERLHAAIGEFSAGAGHEINNPMGAILGQAQWLLQEEADPRRRHALTKITDQVARVRRMIRDLRLIGRPSGPRRSAVDLARCVTQGAAAAAKFSTGASLAIDPIPSILLDGCSEEISRLFEEIIRNALEAAGATGHVAVTVDLPDDRWVRVTVTDSGVGFSSEARRHAFTPFHSGRSAGRGLGMGLAVARRIAVDHGGQLHLGVGRPTRVRIMLPGATAALRRAAA